jgi:hypothetical protein
MILKVTFPARKSTKARATIGEGHVHEVPDGNKILNFAKEFVIAVKDGIVSFLKTCWNYTEAITILILSSLGLNALLGELPFYFQLPIWIEATMVIPVLSVLGISILLWSMSKRASWRVA